MFKAIVIVIIIKFLLKLQMPYLEAEMAFLLEPSSFWSWSNEKTHRLKYCSLYKLLYFIFIILSGSKRISISCKIMQIMQKSCKNLKI